MTIKYQWLLFLRTDIHIRRLSMCSFKLKTLKNLGRYFWILTSTKNLVETIVISFLCISSCKKLLIITLSLRQEADKHLYKSWLLNSAVGNVDKPK